MKKKKSGHEMEVEQIGSTMATRRIPLTKGCHHHPVPFYGILANRTRRDAKRAEKDEQDEEAEEEEEEEDRRIGE
uniref:Uncharacterized protein n=1 Tax=Vespula pensylvanica TaxID=30213 RepID=A0A834JWL9_VESPE|nr:hypothetical protein H0235_016839 [Vespula pensylvanica]